MEMKENVRRRRKEICAGKESSGVQVTEGGEISCVLDNYLCLSTGKARCAPGILVTVHCVLQPLV